MGISTQCSLKIAIFTAGRLVIQREIVRSLQNRVRGIQCNSQNSIRRIKTRRTRVTNKPEVTMEAILFQL